MNEHIAKLAEQAAEAVVDSEPESTLITESEDNKIEVPATFIKEFARLIVLECAGIAGQKTVLYGKAN